MESNRLLRVALRDVGTPLSRGGWISKSALPTCRRKPLPIVRRARFVKSQCATRGGSFHAPPSYGHTKNHNFYTNVLRHASTT